MNKIAIIGGMALLINTEWARARCEECEKWSSDHSLLSWIKGRFLASLVQDDMTPDQVDAILGREEKHAITGLWIGSSNMVFWTYHDLGIVVCFSSDKDGVLRVTKVRPRRPWLSLE